MTILQAAEQALVEMRLASDRDCCVYARRVLVHQYGATVIDQVPIARWHLYAGQSAWEPVLAAADAGIGELVTDPVVGRWHLCQGWRGQPFAAGVTGHTWLWRAISAERGLQLDSARGRTPRVVGLLEWREQVTTYRGGIRLAVLR